MINSSKKSLDVCNTSFGFSQRLKICRLQKPLLSNGNVSLGPLIQLLESPYVRKNSIVRYVERLRGHSSNLESKINREFSEWLRDYFDYSLSRHDPNPPSQIRFIATKTWMRSVTPFTLLDHSQGYHSVPYHTRRPFSFSDSTNSSILLDASSILRVPILQSLTR